jgi:SAM-dependent methyltransferase
MGSLNVLKAERSRSDLVESGRELHDNSAEMWSRYFAPRRLDVFDSFVHGARALYFGKLFAKRILALGGAACSYVEIGVGTAETLKRLHAATGALCFGVDKTLHACELARDNAPGCTIIATDGLRLPFNDASFDVAYSLGVLEHFELDEQRKLLREHARVARQAILLHLPAKTPHMQAVMWFNRSVCGRTGVWADDELFDDSLFQRKFPGLPFRSLFDWAAGAMTIWYVLKPGDIMAHVADSGRGPG